VLELLCIAPAQALDLGVARLALERDDDRTIPKGIGKLSNGGDRLGRPSREPPRLMLALDLNVVDDVGGDLGVAGIQDTPKFVIVFHEAIGFVDEEGRPDRLDIAKERAAVMLLASSDFGVR
jgi:hypothetical protein